MTGSDGVIVGGGGQDAATSKLTISAPLVRGHCYGCSRCNDGSYARRSDVLVTEYGITINPRRKDLQDA